MVDDDLARQEVYRQIDWQWSWRGLTLFHFLFGLLPGALYVGVAAVFDAPIWPAPLFSGAGMVIICALQYRRDLNYLNRVGQSLALPRHLSPFRVERARSLGISRERLTWPE